MQIYYQSLQQKLQQQKTLATLDASDIFQAVVAMRQKKLPNINKIGNVGSFFKNPVITQQQLTQLQKIYPQIPFYQNAQQHEKNQVMLPAGWLIETCGWKQRTHPTVGVYSQQALVLINKNHASGTEVLAFAYQIQQEIQQIFGIKLEIEPTIY